MACEDMVGIPIRGGDLDTANNGISAGSESTADMTSLHLDSDAAVNDVSQRSDDLEVPDNEYCAPVSDWSDEYSRAERKLYRLINEFRKDPTERCEHLPLFNDSTIIFNDAIDSTSFSDDSNNIPILVHSPQLRCAARLNSLQLSQNDYRNLIGAETRIESAGFESGLYWTELVERGNDPHKVMDRILSIPGLCWGLSSSRVRFIGIGYCEGFWTIDLSTE